ncbi:MAG TPA: hypothetical protein VGQ52_13885 [Gemmatimonadaceae bacterium]|nr:hypothetical protein [Gemmatimonadaceae bacterium]
MKRRVTWLAAGLAMLRHRRQKLSPNVAWWAMRGQSNNAPHRASRGVVEEVDRCDLTYQAIKARSDAFNHAFARNGGYKGYEVQAIESLLAQLESLRGELAVMREQVDDWHRIADERAAEIVRLEGVKSTT